MAGGTGHKYYAYDPSFAAAVIFIVIFSASTAVHCWQVIKTRNWYFIPFIIGCLSETIGCAGRAVSAKQTPDWTLPPYVVQTLLLLLGPTLYAASIYMVLGRLIRLLKADKLSIAVEKHAEGVLVRVTSDKYFELFTYTPPNFYNLASKLAIFLHRNRLNPGLGVRAPYLSQNF